MDRPRTSGTDSNMPVKASADHPFRHIRSGSTRSFDTTGTDSRTFRNAAVDISRTLDRHIRNMSGAATHTIWPSRNLCGDRLTYLTSKITSLTPHEFLIPNRFIEKFRPSRCRTVQMSFVSQQGAPSAQTGEAEDAPLICIPTAVPRRSHMPANWPPSQWRPCSI